jgi:hypothetical protein
MVAQRFRTIAAVYFIYTEPALTDERFETVFPSSSAADL